MARRGALPSALVIAAVAAVVLAVLTLPLAAGPTYDSYSWLIWGRDLAHLDLTTGGGTSWKPLPPLVIALLQPLGHAAAGGWLVVARAGAILALFAAARLAWRMTPRPARWLAAPVAAVTLFLTAGWVPRTGIGDAEGLMVAFGLLAIDRHLDGRRGQAFALIVAASLIRIEAWPFALGYGIWLLRRHELARGVAFGWAALPLLWFGGDWLGSGSLTGGAAQALRHIGNSPGSSPHPFRAVLTEAYQMLTPAAWLACAVALVWALAVLFELGGDWRRDVRRDRAWFIVACLSLAAAWTTIVGLMAEQGYAGLPRFLFMATALVAVIAGIGAGLLATVVGERLQRVRLRARSVFRSRSARAFAAGMLAVALAFTVGSVSAVGQFSSGLSEIDRVAALDSAVARAVRSHGGHAAIARCGEPVAVWYTVTAVAWELGVPTSAVHSRARGGLVKFRGCAPGNAQRRGSYSTS